MNGHQKGFTLWFTGLPCSGKTSLANTVGAELARAGYRVEHLDGDIIRQGLCKDLGFSKKDRITNIQRAAFVASLLTKSGVITLVSFVSPYREMRQSAREAISPFIEIFVRCPIEICEKRDVKGMYRKARTGEIENFTGVSDPYEEPLRPEITVDTDQMDISSCVSKILNTLLEKELIWHINPFPQSALLTKAYELANAHHQGQFRKGGLPYITHPVAVAKLLKEAGLGEDVVAAGLLHDVLEDTGCELEEMEKAVGPKITRLVVELTDPDKTAPWLKRKENYLELLKKASNEALVVSCADKTHNLSSLAEGFKDNGDKFAKGFSAGFGEKLNNYEKIFKLVQSRHPSCPLLPLFQAELDKLSVLIR